MNEKEYNNIMYVKQLSGQIWEAINTTDVDKLREIKGELRAAKSIISPLELAFGLIIGAIGEYQEEAKRILEDDNEVADEPKRKKQE